MAERSAANRRCGLVFGVRVGRLRYASHDATWERRRQAEFESGDDGPMWWTGQAGCPAGCGCRETVRHVISGTCRNAPEADAYLRVMLRRLLPDVLKSLPTVKPDKSKPMHEWQCECRLVVQRAMQAVRRGGWGESRRTARHGRLKCCWRACCRGAAKWKRRTANRRDVRLLRD